MSESPTSGHHQLLAAARDDAVALLGDPEREQQQGDAAKQGGKAGHEVPLDDVDFVEQKVVDVFEEQEVGGIPGEAGASPGDNSGDVGLRVGDGGAA